MDLYKGYNCSFPFCFWPQGRTYKSTNQENWKLHEKSRNKKLKAYYFCILCPRMRN